MVSEVESSVTSMYYLKVGFRGIRVLFNMIRLSENSRMWLLTERFKGVG